MKYTGTNSTKGSTSRVTDQKAFGNNFDAIFRKNKVESVQKVYDTTEGQIHPDEERNVFSDEAKLTSQNLG